MTPPDGFAALAARRSQLVGLAHLRRIADEQSARGTRALPPVPGRRTDQLAVLAAEIQAGKVPAPDRRKSPLSSTRMRALRSRRLLGVPLLAAVPFLVLAGGGGAYAVTALSASSSATAPPGALYGCDTGSSRALEHVYTVAANFKGCPPGSFAVTVQSAAGPKGATGAQGPAGPAGPQGPPGTPGAAGTYTPVTASADTSVSDRDDSGNNGNWATDAFTRTVTVTRHSQVAVADCPAGAAKCWFYTATLADSGTFTTDAGAKSPNVGTAISGTVMGTLSGGSDIEFYADSDSPSASGVPGTLTGDSPSTTDWVDQFFAAGTLITTPNLTDWSWTYVAPNTCEKWVDAYSNSDGGGKGDGDITGANACTG